MEMHHGIEHLSSVIVVPADPHPYLPSFNVHRSKNEMIAFGKFNFSTLCERDYLPHLTQKLIVLIVEFAELGLEILNICWNSLLFGRGGAPATRQ